MALLCALRQNKILMNKNLYPQSENSELTRLLQRFPDHRLYGRLVGPAMGRNSGSGSIGCFVPTQRLIGVPIR